MSYRTIAQRVDLEFKNRISQTCACGSRINRKNIAYYFNEYGERVPICSECAAILNGILEVV